MRVTGFLYIQLVFSRLVWIFLSLCSNKHTYTHTHIHLNSKKKRETRKCKRWSWAWWSTPVVSATLKAETGGAYVQGLPVQLSRTLSQNKNIRKWGEAVTQWWNACLACSTSSSPRERKREKGGVEIEERNGKRDRKKERGGGEKTDSCTSSSDLYISKMGQAWPRKTYRYNIKEKYSITSCSVAKISLQSLGKVLHIRIIKSELAWLSL